MEPHSIRERGEEESFSAELPAVIENIPSLSGVIISLAIIALPFVPFWDTIAGWLAPFPIVGSMVGTEIRGVMPLQVVLLLTGASSFSYCSLHPRVTICPDTGQITKLYRFLWIPLWRRRWALDQVRYVTLESDDSDTHDLYMVMKNRQRILIASGPDGHEIRDAALFLARMTNTRLG